MSKRKTVKFKLDSASPLALTAAQHGRLTALAARPDSEIDYSNIPKQTAAVKWSRPGALVSDRRPISEPDQRGTARVRKASAGAG